VRVVGEGGTVHGAGFCAPGAGEIGRELEPIDRSASGSPRTIKTMHSEPELPSDRDQPMDAVIEEPAPVFEVRPENIFRPRPIFRFERPAPAQYVVPRRFGMSAIIGIMTALAMLFGAFRMYNVYPVVYLFFGAQAIVICLAQMFYGHTPRAASAVTGGIFLPLFVAVGAAVWDHARWDLSEYVLMLIPAVPAGALLGYATGTLAAGVFLVMDRAERLIFGSRAGPITDARAR
jgi:hypothetical protein